MYSVNCCSINYWNSILLLYIFFFSCKYYPFILQHLIISINAIILFGIFEYFIKLTFWKRTCVLVCIIRIVLLLQTMRCYKNAISSESWYTFPLCIRSRQNCFISYTLAPAIFYHLGNKRKMTSNYTTLTFLIANDTQYARKDQLIIVLPSVINRIDINWYLLLIIIVMNDFQFKIFTYFQYALRAYDVLIYYPQYRRFISTVIKRQSV